MIKFVLLAVKVATKLSGHRLCPVCRIFGDGNGKNRMARFALHRMFA